MDRGGDEAEPLGTGLLEALPQAALLTDAKGALRRLNGAARKLFGESGETMRGADLAVQRVVDLQAIAFAASSTPA